MDSTKEKQSVYVPDFMTEEEEKKIDKLTSEKDPDKFNEKKATFDLEKILTGFVIK